MLGEKIGQGQGQIIGQRVIPTDGEPKMETSFKEQGTMLGVQTKNIGTYWAKLRADGSLFGEGQGIVMAASGETASWKAQGVGVMQTDGGVKYRGALYYETTAAKWTRLNKIAVVFEFDVDKDGNTKGSLHEWL